MKNLMLYSFLFTLAVALWGCGGSDNDDPQPASVNITASQESINAPAEGGTYTVNVTTTGKEWGAYADADFISVETKNATSQQGSVTVTVKENPTTDPRTGNVMLMSGAARQTISVTQAAAAQSAYNAPEGYTLVWQDEFDKGSELNSDDWTHEVKGSGWVNNELQNYVNHKTPEGNLVTEIRNGKLRITALKENGKVYSGRVYAKVKSGWTYGYIEASIKLPKGRVHGPPSG